MKTLTELKQIAQDATQGEDFVDHFLASKLFSVAFDPPTVLKLLELIRVQHEALKDIYSGWQYIRVVHGDLYGVGWDRCDKSSRQAIAAHDAMFRATGEDGGK